LRSTDELRACVRACVVKSIQRSATWNVEVHEHCVDQNGMMVQQMCDNGPTLCMGSTAGWDPGRAGEQGRVVPGRSTVDGRLISRGETPLVGSVASSISLKRFRSFGSQRRALVDLTSRGKLAAGQVLVASVRKEGGMGPDGAYRSTTAKSSSRVYVCASARGSAWREREGEGAG